MSLVNQAPFPNEERHTPVSTVRTRRVYGVVHTADTLVLPRGSGRLLVIIVTLIVVVAFVVVIVVIVVVVVV